MEEVQGQVYGKSRLRGHFYHWVKHGDLGTRGGGGQRGLDTHYTGGVRGVAGFGSTLHDRPL